MLERNAVFVARSGCIYVDDLVQLPDSICQWACLCIPYVLNLMIRTKPYGYILRFSVLIGSCTDMQYGEFK